MGARERINKEKPATKRQKMNAEETLFYRNLGNQLKHYINKYDISMEYIKTLLDVHRETVYMSLDGRRKITAMELYKYSNLLNVSTDELMGNEKDLYMDKVVFDEYNKLTQAEKIEIYNYMRFKNSTKDSKDAYNKMINDINQKEEVIKDNINQHEEQLSLIEDLEII